MDRRRLQPTMIVVMLVMTLMVTPQGYAQNDESQLLNALEDFLQLMDEREVTVYDAIEYFGENYDYLPSLGGYEGTLMYDFLEEDGGSFLLFNVYEDDVVDLYTAEVIVSDEFYDPIDPVEFQDWMADFIQQDLTDLEGVTEGQNLAVVSYNSYDDGTADMQYIYDHFAIMTHWETGDIEFYTFRHLNDTGDVYIPTEEDVAFLQNQVDLHIDDVRDVIGDNWRGLYYLEKGNLSYYWTPPEGYTILADVDEDGFVINLDITEIEDDY